MVCRQLWAELMVECYCFATGLTSLLADHQPGDLWFAASVTFIEWNQTWTGHPVTATATVPLWFDVLNKWFVRGKQEMHGNNLGNKELYTPFCQVEVPSVTQSFTMMKSSQNSEETSGAKHTQSARKWCTWIFIPVDLIMEVLELKTLFSHFD